ncbi:hypothetical protein [Actinotalea sp.]|uniref:hypothetical protein n=1 Tax=Actinotalea sp. TaxID=1872145 RepID=UPI00356AD4ED
MRSVRVPGSARDEGSGSVLLVAVVLLVGALAMTVAGMVTVQGARSSARAAADLAALGAAGTLALPIGVDLVPGTEPRLEEACARAAELAERNGARLVGCVGGDGGAVRVEVARGTPWGPALAAAVAGPLGAR